MKPLAVPTGLELWRLQPVQRVNRRDRPSLDQKTRLPQLALEKHDVRGPVATHPVLGTSVGSTPVEDVQSRGIEVEAGRVVLVLELAGAVWIRAQVLARPRP